MNGLDRFVAAVSHSAEPRRWAGVGLVESFSADEAGRPAVEVRFGDQEETWTCRVSAEVYAARATLVGGQVLVVFGTPPVAVSALVAVAEED